MPATRSRTSTEQAAEVASEEVKQQPQDEKEIVAGDKVEAQVDADEVSADGAEKEAAAIESEESGAGEESVEKIIPAADSDSSAPSLGEKKESNGTVELETEKNGDSKEAEAAADIPEAGAKRKSEAADGVGDGDGPGPDSTDAVCKKPKVDALVEEKEVGDDVAPVEASA